MLSKMKMKLSLKHNPLQFVTAASLVLASLLFMRAVSVQAQENIEEDYEEVYEPKVDRHEMPNDERSSIGVTQREVRFTRPEEAQARRELEPGEDEYEQVEGSEKLAAMRVGGDSSSSVAKAASQVTRAPASAVPVPAHGGVIEPVKVSSENPRLPQQSPVAVRDDFAAAVEAQASPVNVRRNDGWKSESAVLSAERVRGVQEVSIIVSDEGYYPSRIFVTQGVPVRMYLSTPSKSTLCVMVDQFGVKKGVTPGHVEEVSFVPDQAGDFRFYCPVKAIEGRITVRALSEAEGVAAAGLNTHDAPTRVPASVARSR